MGAKIGLAMDETVISLTHLVMGHSLALILLIFIIGLLLVYYWLIMFN
jgi:hypothetical protein